RSDAYEADRFARGQVLAQPAEKLNEVQLIEQVVLEPQHELVVRLVRGDRLPPDSQIVHRIDVGRLVRSGQVAAANIDGLRVADAARYRPFVQRVAPDRSPAWNACLFDDRCGARAIGNMKEAGLRRIHDASLSRIGAPGHWTTVPIASTRGPFTTSQSE